jgi:2,3-bisphosphoglycerate-independent phosphoglycerate mutase
MEPGVMRKVLLVILDGWGHTDFAEGPWEGNAVAQARVPCYRGLYDARPRASLACSGREVGLPDGQMGNSEVGHLNLGAGRIVNQDIVRVDAAAENGSLGESLGLPSLVPELIEQGRSLHLVGLVSDGGVHSHLRHLIALLGSLPPELHVRVHCITDGRDTSPTGGLAYVGEVETACAASPRWRIATVSGRYYAMDRDKRWERTKLAYDCIVRGVSDAAAPSPAFLTGRYDDGVTDEFIPPTLMAGVGEDGMREGDAVVLFNFRADRMRQFTAALTLGDFDGFEREGVRPHSVVTLTEYERDLPVQVAFAPKDIDDCLVEVLAREGRTTLKVAETEKYAHVTYFFNGGNEVPYDGEDRRLIPSPKVATYDLQPEMSAAGVAEAVASGVSGGKYDFILVNFANPDMVGHTGSIPAATRAVEAVDGHLERILDIVSEHPDWLALVTADHGNCEKMLNADGSMNTAHTTEPVDVMVFDPKREATQIVDGRLADVAPTVLSLMGIPIPTAMTGRCLIQGGEVVG